MINFDEEISKYKKSMPVTAIEQEIIKTDMTDMKDIMMELLEKQLKEH